MPIHLPRLRARPKAGGSFLLGVDKFKPKLNMVLEAWFMDDNENEDPRLPHHRDPKEFVSEDYLDDLGLLRWKLNPDIYENDEELKKIRETRGYTDMDIFDVQPEKLVNYDENLKNFYTEHIHTDEEMRYFLEGSGYIDVRDMDDCWIRMWVKPGDLIVLPAGIYHRFTVDTGNYTKAMLRLYDVGEPAAIRYYRPQQENPARKEYIKSLGEKVGVASSAAR